MINSKVIGICLATLAISTMILLGGCNKDTAVPESEKIDSPIKMDPTMAAEKAIMHERSKKGP